MGSTIASTLNAAQAPALSSVTDPTAAMAQGQNLYNQANALSNGDYSGLAVAASGLIQNIPPGTIRQAVSELVGAAEGAAAGAAIGSIIPGWGTVIGAIVGAIVGLVESITGAPAVVEGDIRSAGEQWIFPPTPNDAPYSVIPYNFLPPRVTGVSSCLPFYQLPTGPIQAWSPLFNFCVGWTRPPSVPGLAAPTQGSQAAAWSLCQWHMGVDAVSKAYAFKGGANPTWAKQVAQAQLLTNAQLGGPDVANAAFAKLSSWYGTPASFSTTWDVSAAPNYSLYGQDPEVQGLLMSGGGPNTATVLAALKAADKMPLDWTYYGSGAQFDEDNTDLIRTASTSWNVGLYFADTLRLALAECAVLGYSDQSVMHFLLGLMWIYESGNLYDAPVWGNPVRSVHPNLARCLGIVAGRVAPPKPAAAAITHTSVNPTLTAGQGAAATGYTFVNGKLVKLVTSTAAQYVNGKLVVAGADKTGYAVVNGKLVSVSGAPSSSTPKGDVYAAFAAAAALAGLVWYVHER